MNADRGRSLHTALAPALLGALLVGGAIGAALTVHLTNPPGAAWSEDLARPPVSATAPVEPMSEPPVEQGCGSGQVVEPGEYESIQRTGSGSATWVIVAESNDRIAPAPLYILSVEGFTGTTNELDLLRPVFERLDGVVVLTTLRPGGDEMASLLDEVTRDFCVDGQRVVTSSVPSLGLPTSPGPAPAVIKDAKHAM